MPPPARSIRTGYGGHQNGRSRIGAQYDQNNERRNFLPNGQVAPVGVVGVGAARPHQASDNIGATSTGMASWRERFPRNPDGTPRVAPAGLNYIPPAAQAPAATPIAATMPVTGNTGMVAHAATQMAPQMHQPSPAAQAYMPRTVPFVGNPSVTPLANGETHTLTADRGITTEYDPTKDAARRASTITDIHDPSRTTRTLAIDPRWGGGTATAKTNGGARPEMADAYAANAEAGTAAALEAAGARQDTLNAAPPENTPDGFHVPDPTPEQVAAWTSRMAPAGTPAASPASPSVAQKAGGLVTEVAQAAADIPGAIGRQWDWSMGQYASDIDGFVSGVKGTESQAQRGARLDAAIQTAPKAAPGWEAIEAQQKVRRAKKRALELAAY